MPFKQQKKAVGYIPRQQFGLLALKLAQAGYERHDGPRTTRSREIVAFRKVFRGQDGIRQNHVQLEERGSVFAIYAHTEPHTERLIAHAVSALFDQASFSGGARMLRNDLFAVGYELMSFSDAVEACRRKEARA